jgi:hypothetical protein
MSLEETRTLPESTVGENLQNKAFGPARPKNTFLGQCGVLSLNSICSRIHQWRQLLPVAKAIQNHAVRGYEYEAFNLNSGNGFGLTNKRPGTRPERF